MTSMRTPLIWIAKTLLDLLVFAVAFWLAFVLRFEGDLSPFWLAVLVVSLPVALVVKLFAFTVFRVPRLAWRCVSLVEVKPIVVALSSATAVLMALRLTMPTLEQSLPLATYLKVPFGVLLIDYALSVLGVLGVRAVWRLWIEEGERSRNGRGPARLKRVLVVGTDAAAVRLASQLRARADLPLLPVGFLDEDRGKAGVMVRGVPVVGGLRNLPQLLSDLAVEQVLIPSQDVAPGLARQLIRACEGHNVAVRVVPIESGDGSIDLKRIRDVAIEDILRREPVRLDNQTVPALIQGRTVLITGAGGSIGSVLCQEVCKFGPERLVLVERFENNLFNVHRMLAAEFPKVELVPCIADISDLTRVDQVLEAHRPAVVFHAAAHKHVPMMEWNPGEAVKNNVLGTRGLADLADAHGVEEFVMISTDKAVRPTSVMGVSKRIAELYIQALSRRSRTKFVTVRFGNVLGSAGSVVPIFKEQIARGGPVTVTHPEMKRFFMTIPEACQLVLEAAGLGKGGEIFILDMGEPVKIVDLARDLIRLSGLTPDRDIEVKFSGVRPGEKLFEELYLEEEGAERTRHPRIWIGKHSPREWAEINRQIEELGELAQVGEPERVLAGLADIVPEYALPKPQPTCDRSTPLPPEARRMALPGLNPG